MCFQIFFLVVVYGLYHGLVFLPVLLSLVGPEPYATATAEKLQLEDNANKNNKEVHMLLMKSDGVGASKADQLLQDESRVSSYSYCRKIQGSYFLNRVSSILICL